jgi:DNA polymerase
MAGENDPDVAACERCPALADSRSRIVNGTGDRDAPLLFVGEAPGEQEDLAGEPFVGRSGDVLDEALADAGAAREAVRITNCVRCRPPENRDPAGGELDNCRSHLDSEVAAVDPDVLVALGKVPTEHLLDRDVAVTAEAGTTERVEVGGARRDLLVCVHPAATLYDPGQRETFTETVAEAVARVGMGGGQGQATLGDY